MVIERKPKKLTEEYVKELERRRTERIERRKLEREEKREETRKFREKEKKKREIERHIEAAKEANVERKAELPEIEFSNEGGYAAGETESRKGKWIGEPPLEDSAGVCYNKEKDVDLKLSDDGKFEEAFVNGVKLNL